MEDALALVDYDIEEVSKMGLNPCCNGRCTRTISCHPNGNTWDY